MKKNTFKIFSLVTISLVLFSLILCMSVFGVLSLHSHFDIALADGEVYNFNQNIRNGNFSSVSVWSSSRCSYSVDDQVATLVFDSTQSNTTYGIYQAYTTLVGHKYIFICTAYSSLGGSLFAYMNNQTIGFTTSLSVDDFVEYSRIFTVTNSSVNVGVLCNNGGTLYLKNVMLIDLTQLGLESISTLSEFKSIFPSAYYEYTTSTILSTSYLDGYDDGYNSGTIDGNQKAYSDYLFKSYISFRIPGVVSQNNSSFYYPTSTSYTYTSWGWSSYSRIRSFSDLYNFSFSCDLTEYFYLGDLPPSLFSQFFYIVDQSNYLAISSDLGDWSLTSIGTLNNSDSSLNFDFYMSFPVYNSLSPSSAYGSQNNLPSVADDWFTPQDSIYPWALEQLSGKSIRVFSIKMLSNSVIISLPEISIGNLCPDCIRFYGQSTADVPINFCTLNSALYQSGIDFANTQVYPDSASYQAAIEYGKTHVDESSLSWINGFNEGVSQSANYTFYGLVDALTLSPIRMMLTMLDFNILGINMKDLYMGLITLSLVIMLVGFILGKIRSGGD